MNERSTAHLPKEDLDNVCFIIINHYEDKRNELGVGPLNDGNLIAHLHHRLGYKVFYIHNTKGEIFVNDLGFFMKYAKVALTFFSQEEIIIQMELSLSIKLFQNQ